MAEWFSDFSSVQLFSADTSDISVALYAAIQYEYPARSFAYNADFEVKVIKIFIIILSPKNILFALQL